MYYFVLENIMKRIVALIILFVLIPFSLFAISLSELQNNSRYEKVDEVKTAAFYVDNYSVKSLRYNPPFYTMQADVYIVNYDGFEIFQTTSAFNYDFKRSKENLFKKYIEEMVNNGTPLEESEFYKKIDDDFEKDTGITCTYVGNVNVFDLNGNHLHTGNYVNYANEPKKLMYYSDFIVVADYVFHKYYNIHFIFV